jgi:DNA-binding MarR family transcriptional regulator
LCKDLEMATSPTTDDAVSEFAGQLFFRLWRVSHTRTAEALESRGLTTALFALLNVLGTREGAIQQELGSAMGVDPSTMVSSIDQLEAAGLAKRRPRPTDRRTREVVITPRGRRVLEQPGGWRCRWKTTYCGGSAGLSVAACWRCFGAPSTQHRRNRRGPLRKGTSRSSTPPGDAPEGAPIQCRTNAPS